MEGTVTAMDKEGNVLLVGKFFDLNSRKALEISIRVLYGIHVYATTITPAMEAEKDLDKQMGLGEDDYWLPDISDSNSDSDQVFRKII